MVQYHGLGLLYQIRKTDRLGVTKLVAKLTKMPLKSPYAACHLVILRMYAYVKIGFQRRVLISDPNGVQTNRRRRKCWRGSDISYGLS